MKNSFILFILFLLLLRHFEKISPQSLPIVPLRSEDYGKQGEEDRYRQSLHHVDYYGSREGDDPDELKGGLSISYGIKEDYSSPSLPPPLPHFVPDR